MSAIKHILTSLGISALLLSGCKKEEAPAPAPPSDSAIEYKFKVAADDSFTLTEAEKEIHEVALLVYDEEGKLIRSVYSDSALPELSVRIPHDRKIGKVLALANFSGKEDWGIVTIKEDGLEAVNLKEWIEADETYPDNHDEWANIGFGTAKKEAGMLSLPLPMAGSIDRASKSIGQSTPALQQITLTPLATRVKIKNASSALPRIKEITFRNVRAFNPLATGKEGEVIPMYVCNIQDVRPGTEEEKERTYYLPSGSEALAAAELEDASGTSEIIECFINTTDKKEPVEIEVSERQLSADADKVEFEAEGGERVIQINSNLAWSASFANGSFSVEPASGEGNGTITVRANANEETTEINDVLTVTSADGEGRPVVSIPVSQTGRIIDEGPDFTVEPEGNVIELDASDATPVIIITCKREMEIQVIRAAGTWLRTEVLQTDPFNPLKKSIKLTVFENSTGYPRSGKITLKGGKTTHEYTINQSDKKKGEDFTAAMKYNGAAMGNELRVPAKGAKGSLEMISSTGKREEDGTLYLRAATGSSWARITHEPDLWDPEDAIFHARKGSFLEFEENLGQERRMTAEFYSKKSGKVYFRTEFVQPAAEDYLTLSTSSMSADRYGNVYDQPFELKVSSNKAWEIRNGAAWVSTNYTPGERLQTVEITVEENNSGQARSAQLEFVTEGKVVKSFTISQSTQENASFTLKYELNLEMTTTNNRLKGVLSTSGIVYYANRVEIFNPGTSSNEDETVKIISDAPYGFVTDAPASFNRMVVNNIADKLLVYPNYRGAATTQSNSGGINIHNNRYSQSFFRQIRYTLPIPAGVKRSQKVVYKVVINNITANAQHDAPVITYTIANQ